MRRARRIPWIAIAAAAVCIFVFPSDVVRSVLATAAATLFEALPFLIVGRLRAFSPFIGCGCGAGPAARSIPATIACWLTFGPVIALARFGAAGLIGWFFHLRNTVHGMHASDTLLSELASIAPYGIVAGMFVHLFPLVFGAQHLSMPIAGFVGVVVGFFLAPCGLGVVGVASALHAFAPGAAIGFLCTAGVCDLRALVRIPKLRLDNDRFAYAILAIACAFVAWQHGAELVHPRFTLALWGCAIACVWFAWRTRTNDDGTATNGHRAAGSAHQTITNAYRVAWILPATMFAIAIVGAPMPSYTATATTLDRAFAGERLRFTGVFARMGGRGSLTRYAITCCRADAAPVSVLLAQDLPVRAGQWIQADGTIESVAGELRLRVAWFARESAPSDPFLYR